MDVAEQQLRIETMEVALEKSRLDVEKLRQDIRTDSRRFALTAIGTAIALIAATAAAVGVGMNWIIAHEPHPAPVPPQIIYIQPPVSK